jgi:hypothetical protein
MLRIVFLVGAVIAAGADLATEAAGAELVAGVGLAEAGGDESEDRGTAFVVQNLFVPATWRLICTMVDLHDGRLDRVGRDWWVEFVTPLFDLGEQAVDLAALQPRRPVALTPPVFFNPSALHRQDRCETATCAPNGGEVAAKNRS